MLRNYLHQQELITIAISGGENATDSLLNRVHPLLKQYKYGVAQPGVLCVDPEKKVLFTWAVNPKLVHNN